MKAVKLFAELRSFAVPDDLQVKIVHRKDGVDQHYHIKPHQSPIEGLNYLRDTKNINSWQQNPVAAQLEPQDPQAVKFLSDMQKNAGPDFSWDSWKNPASQGTIQVSTVKDPKELWRLQQQLEQDAGDHNFEMELKGAYDVHYPDPEFDQFAKTKGNVQELYHGVGNQRAGSLLASSFREPGDVGAVTGNMFGDGVYFTNVSSKAAQYIGDGQWFGNKKPDEGYLLQADVVMGKTYMASEAGGIPEGNLTPYERGQQEEQAEGIINSLNYTMSWDIFNSDRKWENFQDLLNSSESLNLAGTFNDPHGLDRGLYAHDSFKSMSEEITKKATEENGGQRQAWLTAYQKGLDNISGFNRAEYINRDAAGSDEPGTGEAHLLMRGAVGKRLGDMWEDAIKEIRDPSKLRTGWKKTPLDLTDESFVHQEPLSRGVYDADGYGVQIDGAIVDHINEHMQKSIGIFNAGIDNVPPFQAGEFHSVPKKPDEYDRWLENYTNLLPEQRHSILRGALYRYVRMGVQNWGGKADYQDKSFSHGMDSAFDEMKTEAINHPDLQDGLDELMSFSDPERMDLRTDYDEHIKNKLNEPHGFDSLTALPRAKGSGGGVKNLQYPEMVVYNRHQAKIKRILHVQRTPKRRNP